MAEAGVDQYTFHVQPCFDVPFVCRKVKEAGMKVGCVSDYYMISRDGLYNPGLNMAATPSRHRRNNGPLSVVASVTGGGCDVIAGARCGRRGVVEGSEMCAWWGYECMEQMKRSVTWND